MTDWTAIEGVSDGDPEELRAQFEREFHSRTLAYLPGYRDDGRAVVVVVDELAHCPAGHVLTHALVNLLARAHRHIIIVGDLDQPLLCSTPFDYSTLDEATVGLASAINPYIELTHAQAVPADRLLSLGVGAGGADIDLGADRWVATVGTGATISCEHETLIGAGLAACLGSYAAFNTLLGGEGLAAGSWSAWDYGAPGGDQGPGLDGSIDVGRVLCVGAGAVANALLFFGRAVGLAGDWLIADGDAVDISNLNRQMIFLAGDTGWPGDAIGRNKADVVAARGSPGASSSPNWYGDDPAATDFAGDLVLALANEGGVRSRLAHRQPTVLLHATTSPNWQAQAHRHVAGVDDCLHCRLPPEDAPRMGCSEGKVQVDEENSMDAALPFLSATAGLMLSSILQ